jgi:hypothetical protein
MEKFLKMGVDRFYTDNPELLIDIKKQLKK